MEWWAKILGLDDSKAAQDSQHRTEKNRVERGKDNRGETKPDSENDDPAHSCGGKD